MRFARAHLNKPSNLKHCTMSDPRILFLGEHNEWTFLLECVMRTVLMFFFALALMKISGKKEVRQFSVLELMVIIGLGSALGDPMIYVEAPILPSLVAISTVLFCYWALNRWTNRSPKLERIIEGQVRRVLHDGILDLTALDAEGMSPSEFFGDLRERQVEHLGQVKAAYVEIDGKVSIFFHADEDVKPGLPIAPESLALGEPMRSKNSLACCCVHCGSLSCDPSSEKCTQCSSSAWVQAVGFKRVA